MVTKAKPTQKSVKLGKLPLKKETIKDLTPKEAKKIKGGIYTDATRVATCPSPRPQ